ncbi:bifunctional UDP-N-acetylglucosamine diphosphorylase/glucosamine-1-phosphate N-acetyltransferase GlmU [Aerococcus urinae]|nr:bifunctional UDP-N-acetylglucosamine diphosphorylase/glucosamine-1-phosphate N-acetyltransferase GlmU [Aerococcus urinae]MDK7303341.1 bifunctional UDP-N-acetylglucosamine diphosphorylase/glucosamine-1-phosphate N-acetyltransferase GlmU [Aerococcus urinae]RAV69301.1 bifunctional UDP-N-acetylglucosamine diphosphorylase/glucosamine-1-phosphate N-acetyltransferase GlmU [Aerococcus urinae]RAW04229.1 bifunctional UDP-N-acetylglucosamine diphosphorylase/glucosamine-1-phosphate N-acetyltransferase Gl
MMDRYAIILAAGKGTRMKSNKYKVLHEVANKPMVAHVLDNVKAAGFNEVITIVGFGAEEVEKVLAGQSQFCLQEEQLGTGHAVLQAEDLLADKSGSTLVICGDTPLITQATLEDLLDVHEAEGAKASILTAKAEDPSGYGRIIRKQDGSVAKIVEEKDAKPEEKAVKEINTGTYVFDNQALFEALHQVGNDNAQGEYYLPDVIEILRSQGERISAYQMADFGESLGVNDRQALAQANQLYYQRNNRYWMDNGVTILDPQTTKIDAEVSIGQDTIIEGQVNLLGQTRIGKNCHILGNSQIVDSQIGDEVTVDSSKIESSQVGSHTSIGPMAHLRPQSVLGEYVHIGNFVEIKNASLGDHTKAGHLTYVGDADLGSYINLSCGVIFCNYDGYSKHRSQVGDYSFIGSNANIVAPVSLADHSFVAAGSTITEDVPKEALAIARSRQSNKENYWHKLPISKNKPES